MPRLILVPLLLTLIGCSGGTVTSGPAGDTRPRLGSAKETGQRGPVQGTPRDTPQAAVHAPRGPEQLKALIADLGDADNDRRARAARELQQWGKEAEPAARALSTVVATSAGETRQAALDALAAIYPAQAADLRALVADEDAHKRIAAEKHLADLGAQSAAPFLPIIGWRIAALPAEARKPGGGYAFAGEEYAALVPILVKVAIDQEGFKAIVACATVTPEGGKPLWEPAQLTLCELAKQGKDFHKEALSALDSSLSNRTSVATIRAVGDIGTPAKGLVPLLQTLAADRDENVRKAAAEALKKIQG
jgi:hypothetical protein